MFPALVVIGLVFAVFYVLDTQTEKKIRACEAITLFVIIEALIVLSTGVEMLGCGRNSTCGAGMGLAFGGIIDLLFLSGPAFFSVKILRQNKSVLFWPGLAGSLIIALSMPISMLLAELTY